MFERGRHNSEYFKLMLFRSHHVSIGTRTVLKIRNNHIATI